MAMVPSRILRLKKANEKRSWIKINYTPCALVIQPASQAIQLNGHLVEQAAPPIMRLFSSQFVSFFSGYTKKVFTYFTPVCEYVCWTALP